MVKVTINLKKTNFLESGENQNVYIEVIIDNQINDGNIFICRDLT